MKVRTIALLSAATLALAACGSKQETTSVNETTNVTTEAAPMMSPAQTFANAAASSDAFEIATSQAALTMSKSAAVKKFAQQMIDAHTASTAKLKAAASAAVPAITPDPALTAEQQTKLDALKASGAGFDAAYVAAQKEAHTMTLAKLQDYAANGEDASLKAFATGLAPTVTAHLNMANALKP